MADNKLRYLEPFVREDIEEKMVFVGGPRQVGKTTLATMIADTFESSAYLNWDSRPHRRRILDARWQPETDIVVFDELHKYAKWKSLIKGIWDTRANDEKIIVTGSSRLNVFRRGGDSLMGRYHYYRLHPFSLREINGPAACSISFAKEAPGFEFGASGGGLDELLHFGGFPEPLLSGRERTLKRWQKQRFERVFREDIRDTEIVRSLSEVELLGALLPGRVGSPFSFSSVARDIEVSPRTIKSWMELLCRNYYAFKVLPYSRRLQRAIRKEAKYYLWDWSEVHNPGARFENMIGAHLMKFCHLYQDAFGLSVELHHLRDQAGREVDFLVTWEHTPWVLVECKLAPPDRFTNVNYFGNKLSVSERYVITLDAGADYVDRASQVRVMPAARFLTALV